MPGSRGRRQLNLPPPEGWESILEPLMQEMIGLDRSHYVCDYFWFYQDVAMFLQFPEFLTSHFESDSAKVHFLIRFDVTLEFLDKNYYGRWHI